MVNRKPRSKAAAQPAVPAKAMGENGEDDENLQFILRPGKLTWNPKIGVWKMIFLFNWGIFRFHVNFQGCIWYVTGLRLFYEQMSCGLPFSLLNGSNSSNDQMFFDFQSFIKSKMCAWENDKQQHIFENMLFVPFVSCILFFAYCNGGQFFWSPL